MMKHIDMRDKDAQDTTRCKAENGEGQYLIIHVPGDPGTKVTVRLLLEMSAPLTQEQKESTVTQTTMREGLAVVSSHVLKEMIKTKILTAFVAL